MATTRIISMHVNQGKTIADCLTDRIDYSKNPEKTQGGELISAYECDPKTADAEFLYSKRQYKTLTGREQQSDVIAYQVRQSFKPGEITPEEANRVGFEFAERFLKADTPFSLPRTPTKSIFIITSSGTPPRWTASTSSAIFSAPAGRSQGSATPSAPSTGCPSSQRPSAGKITTASGWATTQSPPTGSCSAALSTRRFCRSPTALTRF